MNPTNPSTLPYQLKAPSSIHISLIIVLGIAGMLLTFKYLSYDLKINGYKKERWRVEAPAGSIKQEIGKPTDNLIIVFHPQIASHDEDLRKDRAVENKSKAAVSDDQTKTFNFEHIYFSYNSAMLVWMAIFSILFGCSLALLPVIFNSIRNIDMVFELSPRRKTMVILSTVLIGVILYFTQDISYLMRPTEVLDKLHILFQHPFVLDYFMIVIISIALSAIAGQLFINQAISKLPLTIVGLTIKEHNIIADKFNLLRNKLKFFLLIDAVLIVFSVMNTDAFRRAIIGEVSINMDILPKNYVYLYGVLFTFFLAVIYMPIYYRLKIKGELMLKEIPGELLEGDGERIAHVLTIEQTPIESLKVVLSILAPVLTSLVPGLLNI